MTYGTLGVRGLWGGLWCGRRRLAGASFHSKAKMCSNPSDKDEKTPVTQSSVSAGHQRCERPAWQQRRCSKVAKTSFRESFGCGAAIPIHVLTHEGPAGGEQELFSTSVSIPPLTGSLMSQSVQANPTGRGSRFRTISSSSSSSFC